MYYLRRALLAARELACLDTYPRILRLDPLPESAVITKRRDLNQLDTLNGTESGLFPCRPLTILAICVVLETRPTDVRKFM